MAEYIAKEAVYDIIAGQYCALGDEAENVLDAVRNEVRASPAADVVEVVRCKDCRYCIIEDDYEIWCNGFCQPSRLVTKEDFCSHGKRR